MNPKIGLIVMHKLTKTNVFSESYMPRSALADHEGIPEAWRLFSLQ